MKSLARVFARARDEEDGHVVAGVTSLVAAIGAIVLGFGAAGDSDIATWGGGIVLGVGIFLAGVARHRIIDYDIYARLEALEKK